MGKDTATANKFYFPTKKLCRLCTLANCHGVKCVTLSLTSRLYNPLRIEESHAFLRTKKTGIGKLGFLEGECHDGSNLLVTMQERLPEALRLLRYFTAYSFTTGWLPQCSRRNFSASRKSVGTGAVMVSIFPLIGCGSVIRSA